MKRLALLVLFSCAPGVRTPLANQAARAAAPSPRDPFAITLGEATIVEVTDHELPHIKLHATGVVEAGMTHKDGTTAWIALGTLGPDAVIRGPGAPVDLRKVYDDAPRGNDQTRMRLVGETLVIAIPGLDDAVFTLASSGAISLTGRTPPRRWRIDAPSQAVARTGFLLFGMMVKTRID